MPKPISIEKSAYALSSTDGLHAELTMYGEIVETRPTDWWTGEVIEGSFIAQDEFLDDLKQIEGCKSLTIRMNSIGGDCGVGIMIHNRLREMARNGTALTCIVDGVAMSAGSLIICACDNVQVNPSSLVMVHKCWTLFYGGYNADELRKGADYLDAYDKASVSIYARKTGLSETMLKHMMSDTTYMTGKEAVDKGFANELLEDAEPLSISASADGRALFVRGQKIHLTPGMVAPDNIPTVTPEASATVETNKTPVVTGKEEEENSMTAKELREKYPDEVAQVEAEARAAVDTTAEANKAAEAERKRMAEIDEVAGLFDPALVKEAKYGETRCSAAELALRAAQKAAQAGSKFLADAKADGENSGTDGVPAAPAPTEDGGEKNTIEQARADARAYNESKKGVR